MQPGSRAAVTGLDGHKVLTDVRFRWDVKTFDAVYMRQRMEMFQVCLNSRQDRVYEALEDAVKRYESEAEGVSSSKRKAGSTKGGRGRKKGKGTG